MTRDDLIKEANEAGINVTASTKMLRDEYLAVQSSLPALMRFANAILERAAVGFEDGDEWQESRYTGRAVSRKIRALKINTGD